VRIIVCGSRGWTDRVLLERVLDDVLADCERYWYERPIVREGEADGADELARKWAEDRGLDVEPFPADWTQGRGAGHARNADMMHAEVELVVAFSITSPATPGTAGMCRLAYSVGVPVLFVTPDGRQRHLFDPRWTTAPEPRSSTPSAERLFS
jgi:hypothetical protein